MCDKELAEHIGDQRKETYKDGEYLRKINAGKEVLGYRKKYKKITGRNRLWPKVYQNNWLLTNISVSLDLLVRSKGTPAGL